ncbi:MAG TPA: EutN/CcmL family microcompartment protein [Candidatus Faecousia faecigallinarum]|nr:EutN/CcmL family microcompartment protein [Candidatus Faecousia faecigallinarum]
MEIGTVAGSVWATRKAHELGRHTLLTVQTDQGRRVAADLVGAGTGDRVLLVNGSTARAYCADAPVDSAIVAILDQTEV